MNLLKICDNISVIQNNKMELGEFELENKTIEELIDIDEKDENHMLSITLLQIIYFNFLESNIVQTIKKIT